MTDRRATPIAGRYELVERLGKGGMGQVWRGYDAVLDREVAVKLIRPDVISSLEQAEEFARRFRREARVTARILHHGVPQVYDAVLDSSYQHVYLVMEYVRGVQLRTFITPDRPLPVAWAVAVAAQLATVLSYAHSIPVVHRDIKPDNVLVTADGGVKLLDFGIAAVLRTDVTRLTATKSPIGTSQYMSPEQVQGGQITPHSDLYALGCVLHEMLCGRPVFDGVNDFQLMEQHLNRPPAPARQLRADVPEALEELVLQLLAKLPEQRPRDAYEVYERLVPMLPVGVAPGKRTPDGLPDPTLVYRRPNSPLPRSRASAPPPSTADHDQPAPAPDTRIRDLIQAAERECKALMGQERFVQAVEVVDDAIAPAADALGADSPRVLRLRGLRAAALLFGGDYRRALPEFDALAAIYSRASGPNSIDAIDCARQAAYCRAELGQASLALRQFRDVLTRVRAHQNDASDTALDLRRNIGLLLLSEGRTAEAKTELEALYEDLLVVYGPDHEDTQEIADVLTRLRLTEPGDDVSDRA